MFENNSYVWQCHCVFSYIINHKNMDTERSNAKTERDLNVYLIEEKKQIEYMT